MKMYISGTVTDPTTEKPYSDVREKFARAAEQVRAFGHEPVNPLDNGVTEDAPWAEHIVADVALLMGCEGIYLLPDWGKSRGARIEASIATECGMEIVHQPKFGEYESKM